VSATKEFFSSLQNYKKKLKEDKNMFSIFNKIVFI